MAEMNAGTNKTGRIRRRFKGSHRGRGAQVFIYLGKLLRMFIYQSDWKVLPMAALIAGLVGMVVRRRYFVTMEGTVMGSFAMVCVCIWNGAFNSIQVICRERDVIKREHRSGMHISSYIFSHMLYQSLLCLMQVGVTLFVTIQLKVKYPTEGLITNRFIVDFGITLFLITYASDMLSLWISTLAHTTTTAMTIMPFVLIFQLVFSGGMLTLPNWTKPLTYFTISNPGLKAIAAQADLNHRPYATVADMVNKMRDNELSATVTVGQVLDTLTDKENPTIAEIRAKEIGRVFTLGEVKDALDQSASFAKLREEHLLENMSVGDILTVIQDADDLQKLRDVKVPYINMTVGDLLGYLQKTDELKPLLDYRVIQMTTVGDVLDAVNAAGIMEKYRDVELGGTTTIGEIIDWLSSLDDIQAKRDTSFTLNTTVGKILDLIGAEKVQTFLEEKAAAANYKPEYETTFNNITSYWSHLLAFVLAFAALATITLEFIDKDKR